VILSLGACRLYGEPTRICKILGGGAAAPTRSFGLLDGFSHQSRSPPRIAWTYRCKGGPSGYAQSEGPRSQHLGGKVTRPFALEFDVARPMLALFFHFFKRPLPESPGQ
jgi:hypothetical protein